jgi:RNA polymerase sigma factor FliA
MQGPHNQSVVRQDSEPQDWRAYCDGGCAAARLRLIERFIPFARMLAAKQFGLRVESDSEFDDYRQWAMEGLIEAVDHYDPDRGIAFEAFSAKRIRGAILNRLESQSEISAQRAMRSRLRLERLNSISSGMKGDVERQSTEALFNHLAEIAVGLALGLMLENTGMFQSPDEPGEIAEPYRNIEFSQLRQQIHELVERLPEREKTLIKYHYYFDFQFDDIAEVLGVSKGRVSQLHKQALSRMRAMQQSAQSLDLRY